jgi:hypothetical protein
MEQEVGVYAFLSVALIVNNCQLRFSAVLTNKKKQPVRTWKRPGCVPLSMWMYQIKTFRNTVVTVYMLFRDDMYKLHERIRDVIWCKNKSQVHRRPIELRHTRNEYVKPHSHMQSKLKPPEVFVVLCFRKISCMYMTVPMGLVTPKSLVFRQTDRQTDELTSIYSTK